MERTKVFLSYCHEDLAWKHRLSKHLEVLEVQGLLELWCDDRIDVGLIWEPIIADNLSKAKVAVLAITANFLSSQFVMTEEIPHMLQQQEHQGMIILPVLVMDCAYQAVPWLSRLQRLPRDGKAIAQRSDAEVETELAAVAREVLRYVGPSAG